MINMMAEGGGLKWGQGLMIGYQIDLDSRCDMGIRQPIDREDITAAGICSCSFQFQGHPQGQPHSAPLVDADPARHEIEVCLKVRAES